MKLGVVERRMGVAGCILWKSFLEIHISLSGIKNLQFTFLYFNVCM